jgi:type II secretory pathway pseudopilin PulG
MVIYFRSDIKKSSAFTLIELMIVLLIIYILVILSFIYYKPLMIRAYNLVALSDLRNFTTALESSYIDNMSYPKCLIDNISEGWLPPSAFELDDAIGFMPSKDVIVYYDSNEGEDYILATKHMKGDKMFIKSSNASRIYSMYIDSDNKSDNTSVSIFPVIVLPEPSPLLNDYYFTEHKNVFNPL